MERFRVLNFICLLESLSLKKKIIWTGVHGYWWYIYINYVQGPNLTKFYILGHNEKNNFPFTIMDSESIHDCDQYHNKIKFNSCFSFLLTLWPSYVSCFAAGAWYFIFTFLLIQQVLVFHFCRSLTHLWSKLSYQFYIYFNNTK